MDKCINPNDFFFNSRFLEHGYIPEYWSKEYFTSESFSINRMEMQKWIVENLTGLWAIRIENSGRSLIQRYSAYEYLTLAFEDSQDHLMFSIMGGFKQFKVE